MEETTTELLYAMITMILFCIIGGFISYKLISSKEMERAKECTMNEGVKWCSRMKWTQKSIPGFCTVFLISYPMISSLSLSSSSPCETPLNIEIPMCIMAILGSIVCNWFMAFMSPVFAITTDSIILWKYWGYSRSEQYLLSELTRKEYGEGNNHMVVLYRRDKRIKKLSSYIYKDEKTILELLHQIPEREK